MDVIYKEVTRLQTYRDAEVEPIKRFFRVYAEQEVLDNVCEEENIPGRHEKTLMKSGAARSRIRGVWFCVTNFKGRLPDRSPYGEYRINLDPEGLMDYLTVNHLKTELYPYLFLESVHYFTSSPKNIYIRLFLVKQSVPFYKMKWCEENLHKLDMFHPSNKFFRWNEYSKNFTTIKNSSNDRHHFWVEVFVVGDINLENITHEFDEVRNTGVCSTEPTFGIPSQ